MPLEIAVSIAQVIKHNFKTLAALHLGQMWGQVTVNILRNQPHNRGGSAPDLTLGSVCFKTSALGRAAPSRRCFTTYLPLGQILINYGQEIISVAYRSYHGQRPMQFKNSGVCARKAQTPRLSTFNFFFFNNDMILFRDLNVEICLSTYYIMLATLCWSHFSWRKLILLEKNFSYVYLVTQLIE